jgi:ketosteroid isomerase-like protein
MEDAHHGARGVLARDESFFDALFTADRDALDGLLTHDFVIVDVLMGQVASRDDLLGAIGAGALQFGDVTRYPAECTIRHRDSAAVVVGRTRMTIRQPAGEVTVSCRYTHVFMHEAGAWRLMSAQGTPIAEAAP